MTFKLWRQMRVRPFEVVLHEQLVTQTARGWESAAHCQQGLGVNHAWIEQVVLSLG
jgi:hypothetical protein